MYPHRMVRQALMLALLVPLVVMSVSACGGGAAEGPPNLATLKTVVGDGGEDLGDGGLAKSAGFCSTTDVALDVAGNMYISDAGAFCSGPPSQHTVRKVDSDGIITTVAGTGEAFGGYSGDGGPATKAQLNTPIAVAVDQVGNLYISDENNFRIRKVDKEGIITTIAGTGKEGYSGDVGPATSAKLTDLGCIAFDVEGNLYLADYTSVRKIDHFGTITTVAVTGEAGYSHDA